MRNESELKKIIIIGCIGDSLTDGHPAYSNYYRGGNEQSQYQYWIDRCIKEDFSELMLKHDISILFENKGICGEITSQIKRRLYPEIINSRFVKKIKQKPDIVIIVGGTNDLGWGITDNEIINNLTEMHLNCKEEGIRSIGATIPPTRFEHEPEYNKQKMFVNKKLIEFFKIENIPYTDLYRKMGISINDENLKPEYDVGDGLHFSVSGYRGMGNSIYEDAFKEVLNAVLNIIRTDSNYE
ncbi:MAG: hypothetical protein GY870_06110 [archaeon]|nr:hypothetical protein [archaeon]